MARIPLEDNFVDVIGKAMRGLKVDEETLARRCEVGVEEVQGVLRGEKRLGVIRRMARHLRMNADALEVLAKGPAVAAVPLFPRGFLMFHTMYEGMGVNSYLVWDSKTREGAVFDTGGDCEGLLEAVKSEGLTVRHIFLTHTHEDHVACLGRLREALPGADVWVHELEAGEVPGARSFKEGAQFHLGRLVIKALLTSGHSEGLTTYFVGGLSWPLAVVGDALFSCSVGGSDERFEEQLKNDRSKIFCLPRSTVLACGHGPLTTLEHERTWNPFFARGTAN